MTKEKIGNYKKLDRVLEDIIAKSNKPMSANDLEKIILENYQVKQLKLNPRRIGQRLKGRPNIRAVQRYPPKEKYKTNFYTIF